MKYIIDITKNKETKNPMFRNAEAYVLMAIILGVLTLSLIITIPVFKANLHIPSSVTIGISILIDGLCNIVIANFLILRAPQKLYERENNLQNSILKYVKFKPYKEKKFYSKKYKRDFSLMSYLNSTQFFVIRLKFKSIKVSPKYNYNALRDIYNYFGANKLSFYKLTRTENFRENPIWDYLVDGVESVKSESYKGTFLSIPRFLKDNFSKVKVPVIYIKVNLRTVNQQYVVMQLIEDLLKIFEKTPNNFADMDFLDYKGYKQLCQDYLRLENLDFVTSRVLDTNIHTESYAEVFRVVSHDDEILYENLDTELNTKVHVEKKRNFSIIRMNED